MNAQLSRNDLISLDDQMQDSLITPAQSASLPLADVAGKAGALDCDGGLLSSAAGLVLLKDVEAQRGLYRAWPTCSQTHEPPPHQLQRPRPPATAGVPHRRRFRGCQRESCLMPRSALWLDAGV